MKRISALLLSVFTIIYLSAALILYADGPGVTTAFNPVLTGGIQGMQSTAYDSRNNQFILAWIDMDNDINCTIYDATGTQVGSQNNAGGTSSNSPFVCYNSIDSQYLVSYPGVGPTFTILNDTGTILQGPISIPVDSNLVFQGDILCCYNSVDNQYCLTWTAFDGTIINPPSFTYFIIVNANGSLATSVIEIIPTTEQTTTSSTDSFVSYNSVDNEYFFTWLSSCGDLLFAICDASGDVVVPVTVIPQAFGASTFTSIAYSCYNSIANQYFITWHGHSTAGQTAGEYNAGFFAICNAIGDVVVPATEIISPQYMYSAPVCSYNGRNNQYLLSWNVGYAEVCCTLLDVLGNVVFPSTVISTNLLGSQSTIFNAFSTTSDAYFMTWFVDNVNAYFNIFTSDPIPATPLLTGVHLLNRFANYGEYVNQIMWAVDSSYNIASYKIYRGQTLIATVPSSISFYQDHNQPNSPITYAVQVVTFYGDESLLATITL